MAIPSGLGAQLGAKKETTYGTRVVPDKFFEFNSEGVQLTRNRVRSTGLRAGRSFQRASRVATTTRAGEGPVNLDFVTSGMGFWLDLLHGETVTPVQQGTSTVYLQTHNIGTSNPNKSATIQVGKPGTDETVRPFDYVGSMVTEATFSVEVDGFLTAEFALDVRDRKTDQSLAVASYPTDLKSFHFGQCTPKVNNVDVTDVFESASLAITLARATERFKLGAGGLKAKPIQNEYASATCELAGDFKDLTNQNLFDGDAIFPLVLTFTGENGAEVVFTAAACQIEGNDPTVEGPDILQQSLNLTILDDGTNPPVKIEYKSVDTTL